MFPTFWKCRNISSIFQMSFCSFQKLELFLHLKNVEMFPTFLEMQEYFLHFLNVFLQFSKVRIVPAFTKCRHVSYILEMQEYFLHFQKLELFLHLQSVDMFPTFWKCRNISCILQMCFCSCQKLNCSYILKMQKCFLHFGNAGILLAFFKCVSAVVKS